MTSPDWLPSWLAAYPWVQTLTAFCALLLIAWLASFGTRRVLVQILHRALGATSLGKNQDFSKHSISTRLANIVPAFILLAGIELVPGLPDIVTTIIRNVSSAFIVLTLAMAISALLHIINAIYERRPDATNRPIKGYLQLLQIAAYAVATILIIATLIDRSPVILLSGLGAMAAVLMLIFQDTLLSLVASVQISSNDIVRVGDWLEMPQLNADGFVIDIALHTVKVQNWDKTITTIPTKRLISDSFKNWRGMQESGGRRIKRSLYLDQNSVRFLEPEEISRLKRFALIQDYLDTKQKELEEWNAEVAARGYASVNMRRVTNIGTFRIYVEQYLRQHPGINQDMLMLVRQMSPGAEGLPLELYCFTSTVAWVGHETTQSDIFDHLFAILPEFGLRVFQSPSGADLRMLAAMQDRPKLAMAPPESVEV
jgi:miniconductance mechanosensitive channel